MHAYLSAPYAGSLYNWFRELTPGAAYGGGHPYYDALYKNATGSIDVALTAVLAYEELTLPFADNQIPDDRDLAAIGLTLDSDCVNEAHAIKNETIDDLKNDLIVEANLKARGFTEEEYGSELLYAITDVLFLAEHPASPVISSPGRQALVRRLVELNFLEVSQIDSLDIASFPQQDHSLDEYVDLIGLTIDRSDFSKVVRLKGDNDVRRYGESLRQNLVSAERRPRADFADVLASVLEQARKYEIIRGAFKHGGRAITLAGAIPIVGALATAAGIGKDAAEAAHSGLKYSQWHEFGAVVKRAEFDLRMREFVETRADADTQALLDSLGFDQ